MRPVGRWPRVRLRRSGSAVVSGWYIVTWRMRLLSSICKAVLTLLCLMLLVMAALPFFAELGGNSVDLNWYTTAIYTLSQWRVAFGEAMINYAPGLAETLHIDLRTGYCWKFAIAGIFAYLGAALAPALPARAIVFVVPILAKWRFRVVVSPQRITVNRWFFTRRMKRDNQTPVHFRIDRRERVVSAGKNLHKQPIFNVVLLYGYRTIMIAADVRERDAGKIAAALNYARNEVDSMFNAPDHTADSPWDFKTQ